MEALWRFQWLTVLLVQLFLFSVSLHSPKIIHKYHTSINSIAVKWTWQDKGISEETNTSRIAKNNVNLSTTMHAEPASSFAYRVAVLPLRVHNMDSLQFQCDKAKNTIRADISTKKWTFRDLNSALSYIVCVRAFTNTEESSWASVRVHPEGRRPPELTRTSPPHMDDTSLLMLACDADGLPKPKVTWYKDGSEVQLNGRIDPGIYQCKAENKFGVAWSGVTHVLTRTSPVKCNCTYDKLTVAVALHQPALLQCYASGCPVTWHRVSHQADIDPKNVETNERIMLLSNGSLLFSNVMEQDRGLYECYVHGEKSCGGKFSNLELANDADTPHMRPDLLFMSKKKIIAKEGTSLELHCIFAGWPAPNVTWTKDKERMNDRGAILKLHKVTASDAGQYWCEGDNGVGPPFMQQMDVTVESAPRWLAKPKNINVTDGGAAIFNCTAAGSPEPQSKWYVNGKQIEVNGNERFHIHGERSNILEVKNVSRETDLMAIQCNISNIHGYLYTSVYLNVMIPTRITRPPESKRLDYPRDSVFPCEAETDPGSPILVYWLYNNKRIRYKQGKVFSREDNALVLVTANQPDRANGLAGNYTCVATNYVSEAQSQATLFPVLDMDISAQAVVTRDNILSTKVILYIGMAAGVVLLVLIVSLAAVMRYLQVRKNASGMEAYVQYSNLLTTVDCQSTSLAMITDECLNIVLREISIPRTELSLGKLLGKGNFGQVFSGVYLGTNRSDKETKVAIKMLKCKTGQHEVVEKFLKEAVLMKDFNDPHVLSLIGISFETDGSPMVVLPFMANGDLQTFVRSENTAFTVFQLLRMGLQVAKGMAYLSTMRFVHRDLAARNCVVDEAVNVKVADFGLSRDLYSKEYYRIEDTKTCIPVRWMAPESLTYNTFCTKSDVWAYGVLLWELMTRGALPYPDVDSWEIKNYLLSGHRLGRPYYCPDSVFSIMSQCWHEDPEQRPSFAVIVQQAQEILKCHNEYNYT